MFIEIVGLEQYSIISLQYKSNLGLTFVYLLHIKL